MTYRFPTCVLNRALSIALSSTALNTKINLNTMRVLPDSADVFAVISRGDLTKLRDIFKAGQTSVYDVSRSGWTLIHTAFTLGRHEIYQFLISEGADLTIDATNGSNVIERAWFLAQKSTKSPGDFFMCDNEILREIDLDEFVSSQQYNLIHKIVLGVTKLDLAQMLETSTADIDGTDIRGSTALLWAAAQGNTSAVRILLENGANPEIGAGMNQRPLHVARNAEVVRLLHEHDAHIESRDTAGRTPLPCFCYRQVGSSPSVVRELLNAGAAVDAVAHGGQTPLPYAVMFGNTQLILPLLEPGANINALKDEEVTPLMAGIRYDQAEAVKCLLENGADWTIQNRQNQNILHLAALHAGTECMELLVSANIGSLNINARDSKGYTSMDYFETRRLRSLELDRAFQTLLRSTTDTETDAETDAGIDGDGERDMSHLVDSGLLGIPGSFSLA
jgi:ankyrin repeat protein